MAERGRPRAFDRAEALQKAMLLFWEKGFQGAAMSELTAAMGINAPSLYACFGSKEGLYREAMALYESGDGAELAAAIAAAPTVRDAIEIYLMRSAALFSRPGKPAGCMIVLSVVHAAGTSEEAGRALRDARTRDAGRAGSAPAWRARQRRTLGGRSGRHRRLLLHGAAGHVDPRSRRRQPRRARGGGAGRHGGVGWLDQFAALSAAQAASGMTPTCIARQRPGDWP